METLAFVVFTVLAPADFAGEQFTTQTPQECGPYMDKVVPQLEAAGWEVMAQCFYTAAPVASKRPRGRQWATD